jgi:serine/threonine-protein kinase
VQGEVLAGRYSLVGPLGSGGMGEVWQARDETLGRAVAVKVLAASAGDAGAAERFEREARAAARLTAPGIAAVYDFGQASDGRLFLVMELVRGHSLAAEFRGQGPLAPAGVAELGAQAARALAAAHARGVVHRDIKPANLLLTEDGGLKVVDFGIAKVLDETTAAATSMGMGTPSYISPEQALGQPVGPAADLYALGCVLYEALTGRPPFQADGAAQLVFQHVYEEPAPLSRVRPNVPPPLEQIVHGLLAKDPATRLGEATEVARLLDHVSSGTPIPAVPAATPPMAAPPQPVQGTRRMPRMPSRRRNRRLLLPLAGLLVFGAALAISLAMSGGDDKTADAASKPPASPSASVSPTASAPAASTGAASATSRAEPVEASGTPQAVSRKLSSALSAEYGSMDPALARDIQHRLSEIDEKLREDKTKESADRVRDLRKSLDDAQQQGKWSGDQQVEQLLSELASALPTHG